MFYPWYCICIFLSVYLNAILKDKRYIELYQYVDRDYISGGHVPLRGEDIIARWNRSREFPAIRRSLHRITHELGHPHVRGPGSRQVSG